MGLTPETFPAAEPVSFAIHLEGISQSFANNGKPREVLKNINLRIAEHAIVALLGASGSGKKPFQ
jgi:ABC-type lipoprotein export system ATPase subunit